MPTPTTRPDVFRAYWQLASERQRVFYSRLAGEPQPWTDDPIISQYKFCNAYRASDRVSQYLIRDVIYQPGSSDSLNDEDTLLRTILFRLFSKPSTWEAIEAALGEPLSVANFKPARLHKILQAQRDSGTTIYTGAFILCANNAYGFPEKHRNHLALVEAMFRGQKLPQAIAKASSLEQVYGLLREYPLIGPFMAYQLAIDINYSELTNFSENDFVVAGPGAQRGIKKCFSDTQGWSETRIIQWMREQQGEMMAELDIEFQTLWGRELHAIDCQNLFCETDKYGRVAFPTLTSNRTKIKAKFQPTALPPISYFYPPKWGLNKTIAAGTQPEIIGAKTS